jgi:hypothetical protein
MLVFTIKQFCAQHLFWFLYFDLQGNHSVHTFLIIKIKPVHLKLHRYFPCHLRYFLVANDSNIYLLHPAAPRRATKLLTPTP